MATLHQIKLWQPEKGETVTRLPQSNSKDLINHPIVYVILEIGTLVRGNPRQRSWLIMGGTDDYAQQQPSKLRVLYANPALNRSTSLGSALR